jgi:hypothetical protein
MRRDLRDFRRSDCVSVRGRFSLRCIRAVVVLNDIVPVSRVSTLESGCHVTIINTNNNYAYCRSCVSLKMGTASSMRETSIYGIAAS